jgi:putative transposase
MRRRGELHWEHAFAGSWMLRNMLTQERFEVGRKHVATLMRHIGVESLYRKPNLNRLHPERRVFPYRLRSLAIERLNQVRAVDICYGPMRRGFASLAAVYCAGTTANFSPVGYPQRDDGFLH